jgi:hypothetical protein
LPSGADLPAVLARRTPAAGHQQVSILMRPGLAPGVLGIRRPPRIEVPVMSHAAAELSRVVARALSGQIPTPTQTDLLRGTLLPRLRRAPGAATTMGQAQHETLREVAEQMIRRIDRSGVTVHGDLATLVPAEAPPEAGGSPALDPANDSAHDLALDLALDLLLNPIGAGR